MGRGEAKSAGRVEEEEEESVKSDLPHKGICKSKEESLQGGYETSQCVL